MLSHRFLIFYLDTAGFLHLITFMELERQKPEINLEQFRDLQRQSFSALLEQRKWLLSHYAKQIRALENQRDSELAENILQMKNLGIREDELPVPPMNQEDREAVKMGVNRKLTNSQIKQGLKECMELNREYPSSYLLSHLHISYQDLKEFLAANPDFITTKGKNKWRTYMIAGCQ